RQITGGLAAAPLMLCSCCITPVFQSVYERGAPLGSALAVMLASPGLNPAAVLLTFILFPAAFGLARVGAALAAVLILAPILDRLFHGLLPMPRSPGEEEEDDGSDVPQSARAVI